MTLDTLFGSIPQTIPHYYFETLRHFDKPEFLVYKINNVLRNLGIIF
jgi:hypothetical protein